MLAVLVAAGALLVLSAGPMCSCPDAVATGSVRGTLVEAGGPAGTPTRPVAGAVYFVSAGGHSTGTATAPDGTFSLTLDAARYRVEGRTPSVTSAVGFPCTAGPVTVQPRATTTIVVICPVK